MSRREIVECDGCGMQLPPDPHTWWAVVYQGDHQDFCSRACLLRKLGAAAIPNRGRWMRVQVGSFAWAMQRVKDGATVRRRDGSRTGTLDRFNVGLWSFPAALIDAEWEEA